MDSFKQQHQINIDLSQTQELICDKCNNKTFQVVFLMRKLSALLSPTGKESIIPVQVFECAACGNVMDEFLPKDI